MCWEAITAIATSLTVLAVLGGALMMHLLTKPKVSILSLNPIQWFYIYEEGKRIIGTRMTIEIKLVNTGSEHTFINGIFVTSDGQSFHIDKPIELQGHGATLKDIICLDSSNIIAHGVALQGTLILEPWHNRRLFIGKKYLRRQVEVFEDEEYNKSRS